MQVRNLSVGYIISEKFHALKCQFNLNYDLPRKQIRALKIYYCIWLGFAHVLVAIIFLGELIRFNKLYVQSFISLLIILDD